MMLWHVGVVNGKIANTIGIVVAAARIQARIHRYEYCQRRPSQTYAQRNQSDTNAYGDPQPLLLPRVLTFCTSAAVTPGSQPAS